MGQCYDYQCYPLIRVLLTYSCFTLSSVRPDIRPSVRPDIRPSVRPDIRPSGYPPVRISVRADIRPSVRISIRPSVRIRVLPLPTSGTGLTVNEVFPKLKLVLFVCGLQLIPRICNRIPGNESVVFLSLS